MLTHSLATQALGRIPDCVGEVLAIFQRAETPSFRVREHANPIVAPDGAAAEGGAGSAVFSGGESLSPAQ